MCGYETAEEILNVRSATIVLTHGWIQKISIVIKIVLIFKP